MTGINCDGLATRFADREGKAESLKVVVIHPGITHYFFLNGR